MEQTGESSRWRRMFIVEAESGWWGRQPFGLVLCVLEAPFLPSGGLPVLRQEDPFRDGGVAVGFQEGMGSNTSAQMKEDGSFAEGSPVEHQVPGKRLRALNPP